MTTFTRERLLTIKQWRETYGPGSNVVLPAEEAEELARIALASLEAEPVAWKVAFTQIDNEFDTFTVTYSDKAEVEQWVRLHEIGDSRAEITPLYAAPPAMVVPDEMDLLTCHLDGVTETYADGWNACRVAMLQAENFRENKNSSTNNFREIAETSTNSPVTPDGWISCSERMPNDTQWCVVNTEYGYYVQCWSEGQGWLGDDISLPECDVINWMSLPEPPKEEQGGSANCAAGHGKNDNASISGKQVNELTMLVKRLASSLKSVNKSSNLPDKAMEYLKQNGLVGVEDVLR